MACGKRGVIFLIFFVSRRCVDVVREIATRSPGPHLALSATFNTNLIDSEQAIPQFNSIQNSSSLA